MKKTSENSFHPTLVRLLDLLFLARPLLLVPVWGFCALGYVQARALSRGSVFTHLSKETAADFLPMVYFSLSVAAVYVFNQIADYAVDEHNEGFPLMVKSRIPVKSAWTAALAYGAASLVFSALHSQMLVALSSISLLLGYVYCFRPWYFTGRPFFDFITNALGYGVVAFAAGWHIAGGSPLSTRFIYSALPYVLLMCAGSISSTIPDMHGDELEKKITTAVLVGKKRAHILAGFFICAAGLIAVMRGDTIALAAAAAAFPFYVLYLVKPSGIVQEMSYKIGGGAVMIIAAVVYPVFLIPSGAILLCTWLYFRFRHGVLYPSLNPAGHVSENR